MAEDKQHLNMSDSLTSKEFHIAFVQPEEGKEPMPQMLVAFELCKQCVTASWLTVNENTPINKQNIFVCQDFAGIVFETLKNSKARIFGPQYIIAFLKNDKPIPIAPHPTYTATMRGLKICCSSVHQGLREDIHRKIKLMGGIVHRQFTDVITHLVAGEVGSKKYHVACNYNKVVMLPEWVQECWKVGKEEIVHATDARFNAFRCSIFKGLNITVSQLDAPERKEMQDLIQNNGGSYSGDLRVIVTTHLVLLEPKGQKYKVAMQKNIHCVKPSWLYESVERGFCLDADLYKIEGEMCTEKNLASTPRGENNACLPDISAVSGILVRSCIDETAASRETTIFAEEKSLNENTISFQPESVSKNLLTKLGNCNYHSSGLFLDGCKIIVSGFTHDVTEKLRKILNVGGATRFNQISDAVSHVILGDEVDEHRKALLEGHFRPHVVSIEWLFASLSAGRPVDEANYYCLDLQSKMDVMSPFSKITKKCVNDTTIQSKCSGINASEDSKLEEMDDVITQYMAGHPEDSIRGKVFSGLLIMVCGFNEEETEDIKFLIVENGGMLHICLADNGDTVDFAVVPVQGFSVPVQAHHNVTNFWVVTCIEKEALQDVSDHPLFTPVPVNSNAQPLKGCVISVSQHSHPERDCLIQIGNLLGAKYQDYFSRKNHNSRGLLASTHLIAVQPEGSKYEGALKWGLPVVNMKWLLKCAESGCKVDEEPFTIGEFRQNITETKSGSNGSLNFSLVNKDIESHTNVSNCQIESPTKILNFTAAAGPSTPLSKFANCNFRTPTPAKGYPSTSEKILQIQERLRTGYQTPSLQLGRVKQLLSEECDKSVDTCDSPGPDTPSKFLNSDVNFKSQINIRDAMSSLDSPLAKNASFEVSPSAKLPIEDLFKLRVKQALKHSVKTTGGVAPHKESDDSLEDDYVDKGPLLGVVIVVSKTLSIRQSELNKIAEDLGGKYRWKYDKACTHFIHQGKSSLLSKEMKIAKDDGKVIVSPEWLYACRDKQMRVEEHLYPFTYNPQLLLDIILHKESSPAGNKLGITGSPKKTPTSSSCSSITRSSSSGNEVRSKENREAEKIRESASRKMDELLAATKVAKNKRKTRLGNGSANSSAEGSCRKTLLRPRHGKQESTNEALDEPYESVPITWDDPTSRLERERLASKLTKDSQSFSPHFNHEMEAEEIHVEGNDKDFNKEKFSADENEKETNKCQKPLPRIMLAGFRTQSRHECGSIIEKLGGYLINSDHFDSSCTHLIVGNPSRSEKYLASIASGKWILEMSYIKACENAGYFVEEENFEWGRDDIEHLKSLDEQQHKLATAAHRWRVNLQQKRAGTVGAFQNWQVIVYTNESRGGSFKRLLKAGSAKLTDDVPPFSKATGVTHAFLELSKVESPNVDLTALLNAGTECLKPEYIGHFLIEQPSGASSFYVPEVLPLLESIHYNDETNGKRKSDETVCNSKRSRQ